MRSHEIKAVEYILKSYSGQYEIDILCSREPFFGQEQRIWLDGICKINLVARCRNDCDGEDGFYPSNSGMGADYLDGCNPENGNKSSRFSRKTFRELAGFGDQPSTKEWEQLKIAPKANYQKGTVRAEQILFSKSKQ